MRIVCCGCGEQIDIPATTKLVTYTPSLFTYISTCKNCGFTHTVRVSRT